MIARCQFSFLILFLSCISVFAQDSLIATDRPDLNQPTKVLAAVYVIDIREIEGSKQLYSGDIAVRLRWKDPRLASKLKMRTLPPSAAWNPAIQLVNRVSVQTTLPEILEVDSEGNVLYRQRFIGQFSCLMDLNQFPFDEQTIPVRFVASGFSPSEVEFVPDPEAGVAKSLSITDWTILGWKNLQHPYQIVPGGKTLAGFQFQFTAKRRFYYFLVQIIIPMTLIVAMSWIVFWLDPAQPGPRVSISITAMLTVVAYRLLLSSFLPRLPFLTRMDYFVFQSTTLVFLSLVSIVAINFLLMSKREKSALKLEKGARWIFPTLFFLLTIKCFLF